MKKRVLFILLALTMCLALLPTAWAAEGECLHPGVTDSNLHCSACEEDMTVKGENGSNVHYYPTFTAALEAANAASGETTITLLADVTVNSNVYVSGKVKIVQNDKTVSSTSGGLSVYSNSGIAPELTVEGSSGKNFNVRIQIYDGGKVTLKNVTSDQRVEFAGDSISASTELTLDGCDLQFDSGYTYTLYVVGNAKVQIKSGCTFKKGISMPTGRTLAEVVASGVGLKHGSDWVNLYQNDCIPSSDSYQVTSAMAPISDMEIERWIGSSLRRDGGKDWVCPLNYGEAVSFDAVPRTNGENVPPLSYQWYDGTEPISGATGYSYSPSTLGVGTHTIRCAATVNGFTLMCSVTAVVTCDHKNGDVVQINAATGVCGKCHQAVGHEADYSWYTADAMEYTISSAKQLKAFANIVNGTDLPTGVAQSNFSGKTVKLGADIDLKVTVGSVTYTPNWTPIGDGVFISVTEGSRRFEGTFDGDGKKISNLKCDTSSMEGVDHAGLFGYTMQGVKIQNLTVEGEVKGYTAGGIVAQVNGYNTGNDEPVAKIVNCTFKGTVTGSGNAGGIAGVIEKCTIEKCANYATVSSTGGNAGGIVGNASYTLRIRNCYNQGSVTASGEGTDAGGLVGRIYVNGYTGHIENSYNVGDVSGTTKGALVGKIENESDNVTMSKCYYLSGKTPFGTAVPSGCGGVEKTTAQFGSGEVAWLLQNGQSVQVWGQSLVAPVDAYPVFSNTPVCKVEFKSNDGASTYDALTEYVSKGGTITLPTMTDVAAWKNTEDSNVTSVGENATITGDTVFCVYVVEGEEPSEEPSGVPSGVYVAMYPVVVEDAPNGSASADRKSAAAGTTVTICVDPAAGFRLGGLRAVDERGNAISLTDKGEGKYSFTMPSSKVTVTPAFAPSATFLDVPANAYYAGAVNWAVEQGITGGIGGNRFAPDESCTRAQIVTFLWRAAGSPAAKSASGFVDVAPSAYYAEAVAWAVENGITTGTSKTTFGPDDTCTRAQAVTFLYRFAALRGMDFVTLQELVWLRRRGERPELRDPRVQLGACGRDRAGRER